MVRSQQLDLDQYETDKVAGRYLERYDPILEPLVNRNVVLLELGVDKGGSLLLWRDYFPHGKIVGVDIQLPPDFHPPDRVHLYEGNQTDRDFLSGVASDTAPEGFDIIVDDASHLGALSKVSFWHLFDYHLKPNGLYVIEDWGTGYWDDWLDGKSLDLNRYSRPQFRISEFWAKVLRRLRLNMKIPMRGHNHGMVGLVKQLVDEQGAPDVTRQRLNGKPGRPSKFESMTIYTSLVFIKKAGLRNNPR